MTDQELRELVRESIAKQLAWRDPSGSAEQAWRSPEGGWRSSEGGWRSPSGLAEHGQRPRLVNQQPIQIHASHGVYAIARDTQDGPCIIEPAVPCTHCDYCKSHGH